MGILRRFHLRDRVGASGEDAAARYLRVQGMRVLERNYRNSRGKALGEIDIVAQDGDQVVFVEVKTRECRRDDGILPEESIGATKLRRLSRIAELWMKERGFMDRPSRFDALSVIIDPSGERSIRHIRDIHL